MKKILSFVLLGLWGWTLFGWDWSQVPLEMAAKSGVNYGTLGEYIYSSGTGDDQYMISSLEWGAKPIFDLGLEVKTGYKDFNLLAGIKFFLPGRSGFMYDKDYRPGITVNFCTLENNITRGLDTFAEFSYDFELGKGFSLSPNLLIDYSYYNFHSNNGYGYFGEGKYRKDGDDDVWWNDPKARYASKVSGIDYERESLYTFIGANFKYEIADWSFGLGTYVSPFTYAKAYDHHLDERKNVTEKNDYYMVEYTFSYFTRIKETFFAQYDFNEHWALKFDMSFLWGSITKGSIVTDIYKTSSSSGIMAGGGDWTKLSQPCGTDIKLWNWSLGAIWKL